MVIHGILKPMVIPMSHCKLLIQNNINYFFEQLKCSYLTRDLKSDETPTQYYLKMIVKIDSILSLKTKLINLTILKMKI